MKVKLCLLSLMLILSSPANAGEGTGSITFGPRKTPGVKVVSRSYSPDGELNSSGNSATSTGLGTSSSASEPVLLVDVTNRCVATNLGGGFDYSFANGVECASFSAPAPQRRTRDRGRPPRGPSAEQIAAALFDRAVSLAPQPELEIAPGRIGLTGLRSFFWLAERPRPIVATATAGATTVTAVAVPAGFVWSFGDGAERTTTTSGRAWRRGRPGSIGHMYQTEGRYDLGVEVVWRAQWRIGTGPWQPLGSFSTSDSRPYPVREILAWLVRAR